MNGGVQIRPMKCRDLDEVVALAAQLEEAPRWPRSAYEAAIDALVTPKRVCLVAAASAGARIVGFVIASAIGGQAEIESIGVAPGLQRQGIGRALLDALIAELRERGVVELMLEVRESNRAATALYGTCGFVQSGRRPGYYRHPDEDGLLFSLELEGRARL